MPGEPRTGGNGAGGVAVDGSECDVVYRCAVAWCVVSDGNGLAAPDCEDTVHATYVVPDVGARWLVVL